MLLCEQRGLLLFDELLGHPHFPAIVGVVVVVFIVVFIVIFVVVVIVVVVVLVIVVEALHRVRGRRELLLGLFQL